MADHNDDSAKITFKRTEPQQDRIAFKRSDAPDQTITNPDGSPLRDKDNTQPVLKPEFTANPAPNLAPGGAMGIRTGLASQVRDPVPPQEQAGLSIDGGMRDDDLWISGRIVTMPGYSFAAKQYEPSLFGIDGGTISKLEIYKDKELVVHYERGWDVEPETAEQKEALHRIRTGLGDAPEKRITAPEHDQSKGHDIEK